MSRYTEFLRSGILSRLAPEDFSFDGTVIAPSRAMAEVGMSCAQLAIDQISEQLRRSQVGSVRDSLRISLQEATQFRDLMKEYVLLAGGDGRLL